MAKATKICAWCDLVMESGDPGADVTHGICPACRAAWREDARRTIKAYKLKQEEKCQEKKSTGFWRRRSACF